MQAILGGYSSPTHELGPVAQDRQEWNTPKELDRCRGCEYEFEPTVWSGYIQILR